MVKIQHTAWLGASMVMDDSVSIGHFSAVGVEEEFQAGSIGPNVKIGHHCIVYQSVQLHSGVTIDDYGRVGPRSMIGARSRIAYGGRIGTEVRIGEDSVVGGFVPNRVRIEDHVTFFGVIAHSYRDATVLWGSAQEPSPIILHGSVVGMNALIVGAVSIGPRSYVAAGEIVRVDIPADHLFWNGTATPIRLGGGIRAREAPTIC